jgi:hypothetical protein
MKLRFYCVGTCREIKIQKYAENLTCRWLDTLRGGVSHPVSSGHIVFYEFRDQPCPQRFVHDALRTSPLGAKMMRRLQSTSTYSWARRWESDYVSMCFDDVIPQRDWTSFKEQRWICRHQALAVLAKRHGLPRDVIEKIVVWFVGACASTA